MDNQILGEKMKYFLFKDLNGNTQLTQGVAIAEDLEVLWSGEDVDKMLDANGWTRNNVPGLDKVNGTLRFFPDRHDKALKSKLPVLTGRVVDSLIRGSVNWLPRGERKKLLQAVAVDLDLLRHEDTISESDFIEASEDILLSLTGKLPSEELNAALIRVKKEILTNYQWGE